MTRKSLARAGLAALCVATAAFAAPVALAQDTGGDTSGGAGGAPRLPVPRTAPPGTTGQSAAGTAPGGIGNGVIHPPARVDPGMKRDAPPSQAFTMPVVPPPGTPGGNAAVIPK